MPYYSPIRRSQENFFVSNFVKELRNGQPEAFMKRLEVPFADGNYHIIAADGRTIYIVGINFSTKTRRINDWATKKAE